MPKSISRGSSNRVSGLALSGHNGEGATQRHLQWELVLECYNRNTTSKRLVLEFPRARMLSLFICTLCSSSQSSQSVHLTSPIEGKGAPCHACFVRCHSVISVSKKKNDIKEQTKSKYDEYFYHISGRIYDTDEHWEYRHDKSPLPCRLPTRMNNKKIGNKPLAEILN
jgi:hypothetical protein